MTLKELQLQAKKLGIKGFSKFTKDQLAKEIGKATKIKEAEAKVRRSKIIPLPTSIEEARRVLGQLSKGNARRMRKKLRAKGRTDLAGARRGTQLC